MSDYLLFVNDERTVLVRIWKGGTVEVCTRFDDAARALDALLKDEDSLTKLTAGLEGYAVVLEEKLREKSAHIVAVWD